MSSLLMSTDGKCFKLITWNFSFRSVSSNEIDFTAFSQQRFFGYSDVDYRENFVWLLFFLPPTVDVQTVTVWMKASADALCVS